MRIVKKVIHYPGANVEQWILEHSTKSYIFVQVSELTTFEMDF